jgi:hypothetical protein
MSNVDIANNGRVATFRTDAGLTVTFVGTPNEGSGATTVDRQYVVGTRYEFHPLNDVAYQDNGCSATREVDGGSSSPTSGAPAHATGTGPNQPFRQLPVAVATAAVAALPLVVLLVRARQAAAGTPAAGR